MKKILLVDDQPNFTKMMAIKLDGMGYQTFTAINGQIALEIALKEQPDLIVTDIMMPVMDGFTFIEKLREQANAIAVPVIFLSAKGQDSDKVRASELSAADFVAKPFSPKELLARMEKILM